jgi:predicted CopG family antitoxin
MSIFFSQDTRKMIKRKRRDLDFMYFITISKATGSDIKKPRLWAGVGFF